MGILVRLASPWRAWSVLVVIACQALFAAPSSSLRLSGGNADEASASDTARAQGVTVKRVVNMLNMMRKQAEDRQATEGKVFDEVLCACKLNGNMFKQDITSETEKIPVLDASIYSLKSEEGQVEAAIIANKNEKEAAISALDSSKSIRSQELAHFSKENLEAMKNIRSLTEAINALKGGMGKADFQQTKVASWLQTLVVAGQPSRAYDRAVLQSFLQDPAAPDQQTGVLLAQTTDGTADGNVILGVLEQMKENMQADLDAAKKQEAGSLAAFEALTQAKEDELHANSAASIMKTSRLGEVKIELVNLKHDRMQTQESLASNQKLLQELEDGCQTKAQDYETMKKYIEGETKAILDAVQILSSEALSLSQETQRPSLRGSPAVASFLQVGSSNAIPGAMDARSSAAVRMLQDASSKHPDQPAMGLIAKKAAVLAQHRAAGGFDKIITLFDNMIALLKEQQAEDERIKTMCTAEMAKANSELSATGTKLNGQNAALAQLHSQLATTIEGIAGTKHAIKELDDMVSAATEQRKKEFATCQALLADTHQEINLLELAKNRLLEFYNTQHNPTNVGLVETSARSSGDEFGFVEKSSGVSSQTVGANGGNEPGQMVIEMLSTIQDDLSKEFRAAEAEEASAQTIYEKLLADSQLVRRRSASTLVVEETFRAGMQATMTKMEKGIAASKVEINQTSVILASLHEQCDWLLANYDNRQTARSGEQEALHAGKSALSHSSKSLAAADGGDAQGPAAPAPPPPVKCGCSMPYGGPEYTCADGSALSCGENYLCSKHENFKKSDPACEESKFVPHHWTIVGHSVNDAKGIWGPGKGSECRADATKFGTVSNQYGNHIGVTCCDSQGTGSRPGCVAPATHEFAVNHCAQQGLSLCTKQQLENGAGWGSGCNFDAYMVWTADSCQVN